MATPNAPELKHATASPHNNMIMVGWKNHNAYMEKLLAGMAWSKSRESVFG